ncbi:MAG: hypothetical protein LUE21_10230 [Oscillospiraceae bacterium]|nr:hypothetical protein [Oscillospiraceae bacterium]
MKKLSKILALALALCLLLSVGAFATSEASGEASDETALSMNADAAATGTAYTITEDGVTANEVEGVEITGEVTDEGADGIEMTITSFTTNGFQVTGGTFTISNSTITKEVTEDVDEDAAGGYIAGVTSGTLIIENCTFVNNGKGGRNGNYTVDCESTGVMVVINSSIIQTGATGDEEGYTDDIADPPSNLGLLISGYARANMSVGQSQTYYYGSYVETEGWAAMSTDSAQSGFTFYSYDSTAAALYGGYGTYADTSCVDWFYASTLTSAEVGAIISNNGEIHMRNGAAADEDVLAYLPEDYEVTENYGDGRSLVEAGRNDFQLHSPDMMGSGASSDYTAILDLEDTDIITSTELDENATLTDWDVDYGPAVAEYIQLVKGANILVKSTSADIDLTNVTAESYTGVLLLTALNSDSMSRYALASDDMTGKGTDLTITDSDISGDVDSYDYQRNATVNLVNSTWSGAFVTIDKDQWDAMWSEEAMADEYCYWILDSETYFDGTGTISTVTVDETSVWNVTGESNISVLTVAEGGVVNGTVTVDGEEVDVSAGGTWEGDIVIAPAETAEAEAETEAAADEAAGDTPAGFDESMNEGLDESAYPHFDEYREYVAEIAQADSFMASQSGIPDDIYAAASPYIAPFSDINSVIGAMDYGDWMAENYPGEDFPTA